MNEMTRRRVLGIFGLFLLASPFLFLNLKQDFSSQTAEVGWEWKSTGASGFFTFLALLAVALILLRSWLSTAVENIGKLGQSIRQQVEQKLQATPALRWVLLGILGVLILGAPAYFSDQWLSLSTRMMIFMILALGLNIAVGMAGLLVLGYAAFYQLGAYVLAVPAQQAPWFTWWMAILPAFAIGAFVGVLVGLPSIKLRGDYLAIVTLGFEEIFRELSSNLELITNADRGLRVRPSNSFGSGEVAYFGVLACVVISVIVIRRIYHSRIGRAWVAIREDELAAGAMGVPVAKMKLLAFALSAGFACVGGVLAGSLAGFVNPSLCTLENSALVLAMVILGGLGSIPGALLGSALLTIIPEQLRSSAPWLADYRLLLFGGIMVIMMLFRPQGLIGSTLVKNELEGKP